MEKSVGLVVYRGAREERVFLLLHHPGGHWDFPKGHVQAGESEHETARRELKEETGIQDVNILDGFRERIQYAFKRRNRLIKKQVIFYIAETQTSDVTISYEHEDFRWLPAEKALELLTFANSRQILQKALNHLEHAV